MTKTAGETETSERTDRRDASLLESAYRRYGARVYSLCLRLLADVEMAESATVGAFALLSREPEYQRDETRLPSYLRELAIGTSLSQFREHSGAPELPPPSSITLTSPLGEAGRPLPLDPARLDALIARLPAAWRIAFVLHDVEGLSGAQIAARLRIDAETVRHRVRDARFELRRLWRFR